VLAAEVTLQSSSLMLDIQSRSWWPEGLAAVGISKERLAPVVEPATVLGGLTAEAARALTLEPRTPVVAGTLDQVAAAVGAGNIEPGHVTETTGTVLALATTLNRPLSDPAIGVPVYLHTTSGRFCALPYLQTGGAVLQWLQQSLRAAGAEPIEFDALVDEAAGVGPGADGVVFLPHLAGEAFPSFDLRAKGAIVGLSLRHGRAHIVRAALEAVAYCLRQALERLRDIGVTPDEVVSLGGASGNDTWRQIKADVCGLPIRRIACPESSLLGVAMLVAVAVGDYDTELQAAKHMTRPTDAADPVPATRAAYDDAYGRFLELGETLRPFWSREVATTEIRR
jgi:xylulokinase